MTPATDTRPNFQAVLDARERIAGLAHRTPVFTSTTLDRLGGARLFLKAENLQRGGAFKFRGAMNAVARLARSEVSRGVATHSSGNHAQALALAARERGIVAHVVMPRDAPAAKRAAVESYGGRITFCEPDLASRESTLERVIAETGAIEIHPFDDEDVIAGQGTAALELLEDVGDIDAIITPVGGGGLLAGTAVTAISGERRVEVIAGEPELADDAFQSLALGERQPPRGVPTVADGLRTALGALNFAIIREHVARIVLVSEAEILEAMRLLWERVKIVVEPSGAVSLAAALRDRDALRDRRVGVILSGGNVDLCRNSMCNFWKD